ncbi:MAG: TetR/AcrR family transcriptional regulator [Spirochaetales bacterium]|nr:TetR/AcrR family transcriptional regulator [Spirochaetales bacterium]
MGISERKEKEKEQRRSDILDGAKRLFKKNGYEKTTMQMIADEAELAKGTLYLYFKDKNEIIFQILTNANAVLFDLMEKKAAEGKTGFEKVQLIAEVYMDFNLKHPESMYFKLVTYSIPLSTFKKGHISFRERMQRAHEMIKDILELGIADGSIRKDLDPDLSSFVLIKLGIATLTQRVFFADDAVQELSDYSINDLNQNLFDLIVYSLKNNN